MASGSLTIADESSIVNTISDDGALYINRGAALITNRSSIYLSASAWGGGAVYQAGGSLTVTNGSSVVNSTSQGTRGGAILLQSGTFTLANNSLIANST
eukprot:6634039-Prymnesium_polylepis.1